MSSLALHLRSPFPRLRKTNAKTFAGFPTPTSSKFSGPAGSTDDFLNSAHPFDKFDSERSTYVGCYAVIGNGKTFGEFNLMSKQDEYRDSAAQVFELAARASSSNDKSHPLDLAEKWLDLADRNRHQATRPLEEHPMVKRAFRGLP